MPTAVAPGEGGLGALGSRDLSLRSPGALSEGPGGCEGRIRGTAAPVCGHLCRAGVQMFLTAERRLFCPSKTLDTPFESLVTEPGWLALVRDLQPPLKGRHCRWLSGKEEAWVLRTRAKRSLRSELLRVLRGLHL